uniref:Uncharacterized protein n=1 Tax=Daphnia galeata TaxID=27404 RepID=A0A8J2S6T5_9CRUS|nr:unnamed protein product [Daphnia galeata]
MHCVKFCPLGKAGPSLEHSPNNPCSAVSSSDMTTLPALSLVCLQLGHWTDVTPVTVQPQINEMQMTGRSATFISSWKYIFSIAAVLFLQQFSVRDGSYGIAKSFDLPKKEIDVRSEEEKDEEKEYGHVALKTDKYYVSIWSARNLNNGKFFRRWMDGFEFMGGVEGSLVLNINVDRKNEDDCDPVEYEIDVSVTNKDLNPIIEEFLLYNKINAEDVTLERGEELFLERQEYDKLSTEQQAKKVKEPQQPITSLLKTEYSISAELLSGKDVAEPFYHNQQSCVSLVFNLLQAAWLKHHPDRPIPIFVHDIFEVFLSHNENKKRIIRPLYEINPEDDQAELEVKNLFLRNNSNKKLL